MIAPVRLDLQNLTEDGLDVIGCEGRPIAAAPMHGRETKDHIKLERLIIR